MMKKALIVDDDPDILRILGKHLSNHAFTVITAASSREALGILADTRPDIIVTDVEMPEGDGLALCNQIRETPALSSIPVIIMSGKKITETDVVSGYNKGADDYVLKPLSYPVLLAKIRAVLRHTETAMKSKLQRIKKDGLEIDFGGRAVTVNRKPVKLTNKEFDMLAMLASRAGNVVSITGIIEYVWGYDPANYNDPHTVEVHISNLRKKLGKKISSRIKAVPGHGYKFE